MGVVPSGTPKFLPFFPHPFEPPVSPASSSPSSGGEDTPQPTDQADKPPSYVNEEPGTDSIENSGVEDRDLKYGMDIVTLADATPPVD